MVLLGGVYTKGIFKGNNSKPCIDCLYHVFFVVVIIGVVDFKWNSNLVFQTMNKILVFC